MFLGIRTHGELLIIAPSTPRLDAHSAMHFAEGFKAAVHGHSGPVALDLKGLDYMDSIGFQAIVACARALGTGRQLTLLNAGPAVTIHFPDVLKLASSEAEILATAR